MVEDLVDPTPPLPPDQLRRVRQVALNEPLLVNKLISPDAHATAVNITIRVPDTGGGEEEVARAAYQLATAGEARFPDLEIAVTGSIPLMFAMQDAPLRDMSTLVPVMYVALMVAMFLFLRSVWGVSPSSS